VGDVFAAQNALDCGCAPGHWSPVEDHLYLRQIPPPLLGDAHCHPDTEGHRLAPGQFSPGPST
jgi:hypothetical protein